jgi:glutathione S-transferase
MILLGRDLSPFVRRSATLLNLLGISYERKIVATAEDTDLIRKYNPLGRVPALILAHDVIVDSHAIVDFALETAGYPENVLPGSGEGRRAVLKLVAVATGVMEKSVTGAYERSQRPAEFVYEPYRTSVLEQATTGLEFLAACCPDSGYFGGASPNLADVNAVVAYDFLGIVSPELSNAENLIPLRGLSERANRVTAFATTVWKP